jgi:hypothetical protein
VPTLRIILYLIMPTYLLANLVFIKNQQAWGYVFRSGLLAIPEPDFQQIATAMQVDLRATV